MNEFEIASLGESECSEGTLHPYGEECNCRVVDYPHEPMTKSELLARYDNFRGGEIIKVSRAEFYNNLNKKTYRNWEQASTSIQSYRIDGWEYFLYSSIWNVGWQGDCDYDEFFFKIERMTQQEIDDMMKWMG